MSSGQYPPNVRITTKTNQTLASLRSVRIQDANFVPLDIFKTAPTSSRPVDTGGILNPTSTATAGMLCTIWSARSAMEKSQRQGKQRRRSVRERTITSQTVSPGIHRMFSTNMCTNVGRTECDTRTSE